MRGIIVSLVVLSSCGFPGPIFRSAVGTSTWIEDSARFEETHYSYFCLDHNDDNRCDQVITKVYDTLTGALIGKYEYRSMNLGQRDGRNRNQQWTTEFDVDGSRTYDSYSHWEIYGRSGRLRKFREVSWDENGKTIHLTRSTKKNPDKLDKTRVRGGRYR